MNEPKFSLLPLREVCRIVGISKSTAYARIARGEMPAGIRISTNSVRWRSDQLADWMESFVANQDAALGLAAKRKAQAAAAVSLERRQSRRTA